MFYGLIKGAVLIEQKTTLRMISGISRMHLLRYPAPLFNPYNTMGLRSLMFQRARNSRLHANNQSRAPGQQREMP